MTGRILSGCEALELCGGMLNDDTYAHLPVRTNGCTLLLLFNADHCPLLTDGYVIRFGLSTAHDGSTNQQREAILYLHIVLLKNIHVTRAGLFKVSLSFNVGKLRGYVSRYKIPFNSLEVLKLFWGSSVSECLRLDDTNLRALSQAGMSFGIRINPFVIFK